MPVVIVSYRLSESGRKAAVLAGLTGKEDQSLELDLSGEELAAALQVATVGPDGGIRLNLRHGWKPPHECAFTPSGSEALAANRAAAPELLDAPLLSWLDVEVVLAQRSAANAVADAACAAALAERNAQHAAQKAVLDAARVALEARLLGDPDAWRLAGIRDTAGRLVVGGERLGAPREVSIALGQGHPLEPFARAELARRAAENERLAAERRATEAREAAAEHLRRCELARGFAEAVNVDVAIPFAYGNPRRYGKPWVGEVIALDLTGRPELRWGVWEGGTLLLNAKPGAVIMWGQRDNRRESESVRLFGLVGEDGSVTELSGRREALDVMEMRAKSDSDA